MLPHGYQPKFDAGETAFVERSLLWIEQETYNTLIPPLEGRRYVPVDNKTPPGANATVYRKYTRTGIARMVTGRGQDLPNAGLFVNEYTHKFFPVGASYQYNYLDLLAAALAAQNGGPPINLDLELALSAHEAIEKKLDLIAAVGSASSSFALENEFDVGMLGLLNQPNANAYTIATGSGPSATQAWSTKTPDEVIADLTGIVAAQIASTYKVHKPNTMLSPISQFETIGGRSMGDGRSDTILSYFMRTNVHIKEFDSWAYCTGAGSNSSDRLVCYDKDPRKVRHMISMEFTQLPPQVEGLVTETACLAQTAGVVCPYPLSISYGDGI